jgi:hypothetical protein
MTDCNCFLVTVFLNKSFPKCPLISFSLLLGIQTVEATVSNSFPKKVIFVDGAQHF